MTAERKHIQNVCCKPMQLGILHSLSKVFVYLTWTH